jgi:hypothetical protein
MESLAGPTLSDVGKASQAYKIFLGKDGFNEQKFIKEVGGRAPFLGRFIRNRISDLSSRPKKRKRKKKRRR